MQRVHAPEDMTQAYTFTLDDLCAKCPLRGNNPRFEPGYGVDVDEGRKGATIVSVTDLALSFEVSSRFYTTKEVFLGTDESAAGEEVESAFEQCKEPVVRERRILPNQQRCGALALILANTSRQYMHVRNT